MNNKANEQQPLLPEDPDDDLRLYGIDKPHPALALWFYISPTIGFFLLLTVPFVMIGLAGTQNPRAVLIGVIVVYVVLTGAVLAPFALKKNPKNRGMS